MTEIARDLASRTGLRAGRAPVLVFGASPPIEFAVEDASHGSEIAAREVHTFPNLGLHLRSRPLGILPAASSLTPAWLDDRFAIQSKSSVPEAALRKFLQYVLDDA